MCIRAPLILISWYFNPIDARKLFWFWFHQIYMSKLSTTGHFVLVYFWWDEVELKTTFFFFSWRSFCASPCEHCSNCAPYTALAGTLPQTLYTSLFIHVLAKPCFCDIHILLYKCMLSSLIKMSLHLILPSLKDAFEKNFSSTDAKQYKKTCIVWREDISWRCLEARETFSEEDNKIVSCLRVLLIMVD